MLSAARVLSINSSPPRMNENAPQALNEARLSSPKAMNEGCKSADDAILDGLQVSRSKQHAAQMSASSQALADRDYQPPSTRHF
eukprot:15277-Heterococcus_DN1.PRE.3